MRLRRIIRANKTITDAGAWKTGVKMPKTAFPLTKQNALKVGPAYSWRVIRFTCLGAAFRVLVIYRLDLSTYSAYLGMECDQDLKVLARYDYHATHPGWHMHAVCDSDSQTPGRTGGPFRRLGSKLQRRAQFDITDDDSAYAKVTEAFKLIPPFALTMQ